jgi:hypothetical protein
MSQEYRKSHTQQIHSCFEIYILVEETEGNELMNEILLDSDKNVSDNTK